LKFLLATALTVLVICVAALGCGGGGGTDTTAPASEVPRAFFGVAPQGNIGEEDLARMGAGNVGTLRIVLPWQGLDPEPKDEPINFSAVDPVVLIAAQNGIQILPTIYGTPEWVARDLDGYDCSSTQPGKPDCGTFAPHSEAALAAWREFIGRLVDRYGPNGTFWSEHTDVPKMPIRTWQIWNEQNSSTFFAPKPDPAAYAAVLASAADAIRKRDDGAQVMLGGMFQTNGEGGSILANEFLRELYGIDHSVDNFDAVAAHPYAHSVASIEDQVRLLHNEIDRAGDNASLWVTEIGASSNDGKNPLELGEEGQAQLLRKAFSFFLQKRTDWRLDGVIWYAWRDVSTDVQPCDWCANAGLFPEDSLDPKPAWGAFTSFTGGN
jgi:hypothetical protein